MYCVVWWCPLLNKLKPFFFRITLSRYKKERILMVPMVLSPNGIEPTFLKLDSWSPGAGSIPYYNLKCIKLDEEKKNLRKKKSVSCIQKTFNAVFKNGFSQVLGSIPRLPFLILTWSFYYHPSM